MGVKTIIPRIKHELIVTLTKDFKAFLRLDAGVGRRVTDFSEKRINTEPQREEERRRVAETRLSQQRNLAGVAIARQSHALPEPDESMKRHQIFRSLVSPLKPGKMLDLGTGRGTFSLVAAQLGWEVTAVDARTARMPNPEAKKDPDRAELIRSIRWVEADVRKFPIRSGEYDLICILGLLHHLGVDDHIKLLRHCSGTLTLLNARIAPEIVVREGQYEGRYHNEPGETREERDQILSASWGNETSFHHTEESLIRLARDCGYGMVMPMRPPHHLNYTFYLCLPRPSNTRA
jgi:SAM-dependent methyltransferase